jgi:hypothetical protein
MKLPKDLEEAIEVGLEVDSEEEEMEVEGPTRNTGGIFLAGHSGE